MSILKKAIVLQTNRHWLPLRVTTPEIVFVDMSKGTVLGLDISFFENPDGSYDLENIININPVPWEEWLNLPVRSCDLSIGTPAKRIRIPTVAICSHYDKLPMAKPRLCLENLAKREGGRCAYTGKRLSKRQMTADHIVPKKLGGKTTWKNLVLADREVNLAKGHKTLEEAGLKLLKQPTEPNSSPVMTRIECEHPSWKPFLMRHK